MSALPLPNSMPVGGGMFGAPRKKPSFFGEGGTGRGIAGVLGDYLLQSSGMRPIFAPAMEQQRDAQTRMQMQQQRMLDPQQIGDSIVQRDPATGQYKPLYTAPQKPATPYRWRSNSGDLLELGVDGTPRVVFDDPDAKPMFIPDGLGGGQFVTPPSAKPAVPSAPVGGLKPVGKLTPYNGGAGSASPRTFR